MWEQAYRQAETKDYFPNKALPINPLEEQKRLEQSTGPAEGVKVEYLQQHPYLIGSSLQRIWKVV